MNNNNISDEDLAYQILLNSYSKKKSVPRGTDDSENVEDRIFNHLKNKNQTQENPQEFSYPKFYGQKFAQGALGVADLAEMAQPAMTGGAPGLTLPQTIEEEPLYDTSKPVSQRTDEYLKSKGVNIHSQGKGNTPFQRITGAFAKGLPATILGGLNGMGVGAAFSGGVPAASQALQEMGLSEGKSDAAAMIGALAYPLASTKIANRLGKVKSLSEAEKKVASVIKSELHPEEVRETIENISKYRPYDMTGYEPVTAEVAQSPGLSTLYRVRKGVPESGLAYKTGKQQDKIFSKLAEESAAPLEGAELQSQLAGELSHRRKVRREATHEGFENLKKSPERIPLKNYGKFKKETVGERGDIESALNKVSKFTKSKELGGLTEKQAKSKIRDYFSQKKSIEEQFKDNPAMREQALSKIERPSFIDPTVGELQNTLAATRVLRKKALKRGSDDAVALKLKEAMDALGKDIEKYAPAKEVRSKYAELSKPVSEIKDSKYLKKIMDSRSNDILKHVFNGDSAKNAEELVKVFKDKPQVIESLGDAAVERFTASIQNAGLKGKSSTLSYPKYQRFMKNNGKALEKFLNNDQKKLLEEVGKIIEGQRFSESGAALGFSPTQAHQRIEQNVRQKLGLKTDQVAREPINDFADIALKNTSLGKFKSNLKGLWSYLSNHKEHKFMGIIDKMLKDKAFAKNLLEYEESGIKSHSQQIEFNRFINNAIRASSGVHSSKEKEKI